MAAYIIWIEPTPVIFDAQRSYQLIVYRLD